MPIYYRSFQKSRTDPRIFIARAEWLSVIPIASLPFPSPAYPISPLRAATTAASSFSLTPSQHVGACEFGRNRKERMRRRLRLRCQL